MTETKKVANVNEVYLRQPLMRKWNLKYKKCRIAHKDFTNWKYGMDQNINCLKYALERQLANTSCHGWMNLEKAIYVMGKRGEHRDWQGQNILTNKIWSMVSGVLRDEEHDELIKSLRYDYFKEEYTCVQIKSAGEG